jgi:hypothetical protein
MKVIYQINSCKLAWTFCQLMSALVCWATTFDVTMVVWYALGQQYGITDHRFATWVNQWFNFVCHQTLSSGAGVSFNEVQRTYKPCNPRQSLSLINIVSVSWSLWSNFSADFNNQIIIIIFQYPACPMRLHSPLATRELLLCCCKSLVPDSSQYSD